MKKHLVFASVIFLLTAGSVWAQAPTNQKIQKDTEQLKKDYEQKVSHDLKVLGHRIHKLKSRTDKKLDSDLKKEQADLEKQKKAADKQLADLAASTGDAWKDLRHGMDKAVKDLGTAVDQAAAQFKATPVPAK